MITAGFAEVWFGATVCVGTFWPGVRMGAKKKAHMPVEASIPRSRNQKAK